MRDFLLESDIGNLQRFPIMDSEAVQLDPTKEVPEETKLVDRKKEAAKGRYKLRHQLESEYRLRAEEKEKNDALNSKNKQYDKKYVEHIQKGWDIVTHGDYDKTKINSYNLKPEFNAWDKAVLASNSISKLLNS